MGSTEIGHGVAIPHNVGGIVYRPAILTAVLERPVRWKDTEVSLVFLLLVDPGKAEYKELFANLYEKINSTYKVQRMVQEHSFAYLKKMISQE